MAEGEKDKGLKKKKGGKTQETARVLYSGKTVINTIRMDNIKLGNKRYFITFRAVRVATKFASSKKNAANSMKLKVREYNFGMARVRKNGK